jgi:uncharacterized protein YbaP (TraB family)
MLRVFLGVGVVAALVLAPASWSAEIPYGQGVFWRIDSDDVTASHLLGTFHLPDSRIADLPSAVTDALTGADSLTLEITSAEMMTGEGAERLNAAMTLPAEQDLTGIVGSEVMAEIAGLLGADETAMTQLARLQPWAMSIVVLTVPSQKRMLQSGQIALPLDQLLEMRAREAGKPVYGLETVDEQVSVFESLSTPDQVAMLNQALDLADPASNEMERLIALYLAGDIAAILAEAEKLPPGADPQAMQAFLRAMFEQRNQRMADRLAGEQLKTGNAFIAVGAGHLAGEAGVLSLLAGRGFRIARVR